MGPINLYSRTHVEIHVVCNSFTLRPLTFLRLCSVALLLVKDDGGLLLMLALSCTCYVPRLNIVLDEKRLTCIWSLSPLPMFQIIMIEGL